MGLLPREAHACKCVKPKDKCAGTSRWRCWYGGPTPTMRNGVKWCFFSCCRPLWHNCLKLLSLAPFWHGCMSVVASVVWCCLVPCVLHFECCRHLCCVAGEQHTECTAQCRPHFFLLGINESRSEKCNTSSRWQRQAARWCAPCCRDVALTHLTRLMTKMVPSPMMRSVP